MLRASERAGGIGHVLGCFITGAPPIRRPYPVRRSRTASLPGERAVADAFARRGFDAVISRPDWAKAGKVGMFAATFPDDGPRVSILIRRGTGAIF